MNIRVGCGLVKKGLHQQVVYNVEAFHNGTWQVLADVAHGHRELLSYECPIAALRMANRLRELLA